MALPRLARLHYDLPLQRRSSIPLFYASLYSIMATQGNDGLYLSSDEESIDAEEIVAQGFRQARNRTNWRYRGTAMTTTDAMDIDSLCRDDHDGKI